MARIVVIGFPDGSKRFDLDEHALEAGDVVWSEGERYVVDSVIWDGESAIATIAEDVEAHVLDQHDPP